MSPTRRRFLQASTVAAAGLVFPGSRFLTFAEDAAPRPIRAWLTANDQRYASIAAPEWTAASGGQSGAIHIDPSVKYQEILGFGAAFTEATCYLLDQMKPESRKSLMAELFGPEGLRFSVGRTCIGASDYSRAPYSYDESPEPDPELKHFSIEHDRAYILPTLRASRALNPDLFLFSSPWSPPGWMKAGKSLLGGSMRNKYFDAYAEYFVRFLKGYAAEGVKINAVTVQNEVDTDQDGRMPAALWGQEYEAKFVKGYLGPALQNASPDTKIWILDHNYNLWGRAVDELSDPDVNKYVDGVAWHGYVGTPDSMTRVHNAYPEKHAYWTEGGPDFTAPDYATDWTSWSQTFTGALKNWSRCIVGWNYLLDEAGKPNIGPFTCGGMITLNSKTRELTRSGQYWAFAHYSKAVDRGARVLDTQGGPADVDHVAVQNPDGSLVLVLTNRGDEKSVSCSLGAKGFELKMPHNSVATVRW